MLCSVEANCRVHFSNVGALFFFFACACCWTSMTLRSVQSFAVLVPTCCCLVWVCGGYFTKDVILCKAIIFLVHLTKLPVNQTVAFFCSVGGIITDRYSIDLSTLFCCFKRITPKMYRDYSLLLIIGLYIIIIIIINWILFNLFNFFLWQKI